MENNTYHDDELRQLFRQLPVEKPSSGFSSRVMEQVMLEAQHAAHRRHQQRVAWGIAIPATIIFLLISGFFALRYWEIDPIKYFEPLLASFADSITNITDLFTGVNGYQAILLGIMVLALLLGDLFIRGSISRKKDMTQTA